MRMMKMMMTRSELLYEHSYICICTSLFLQDVTTQPIEGMYDPAEFADLDVEQVLKIFVKNNALIKKCSGRQRAV